jgi:Flp pilus assembly protein TadB
MANANKVNRRQLGDEAPRVKDILLVVGFFVILVLFFWLGHELWSW